MKNLTLFILLSFCFSAYCQQPCLPSPGGIPGSDEPPGCEMCGPIYQGVLQGFTPGPPGLDFPCGTVDGNQWFSIVADSLGKLAVTVLISSCGTSSGGAESIIYDLSLNPVSNCQNQCGGVGIPGNLTAQNLTPGETYLLMVDQCTPQDSCNLLIIVSQQQFVPNLQAAPIRSTPDRNMFCPPNEACFTIPRVSQATDYVWSTPTGVSVLTGGGSTDTFVCVQFMEVSNGDILVTPFKDCRPGKGSRFPVFSERKNSSISTTICPGESFEAAGQIFSEAGNYAPTIEGLPPFDCDSTIFLELKIPDTSAVVIECVKDTFIEKISVNWSKRALADSYEIYVNDTLVSVQDYVGYIYNPRFSGEEIDIKIQPRGNHGCQYAPASLTCIAPGLSNSSQVESVDKVLVSPNPSTGHFEIISENQITKVEVFDLSGQKRKETFSSAINLSIFEPGIYFFKIYLKEYTVLKKAIKI